jgi:hypothetical protein
MGNSIREGSGEIDVVERADSDMDFDDNYRITEDKYESNSPDNHLRLRNTTGGSGKVVKGLNLGHV